MNETHKRGVVRIDLIMKQVYEVIFGIKKKSDCKSCDSVPCIVLPPLPSDLKYREIDCWRIKVDVVKQKLRWD